MIEWKDEFSLGIAGVDYEHQQLIGLINGLLGRIAGSGDAPDIASSLGDIHAMIALHFALEEKVMQEMHYDEYDQHKQDHEQLLDDIRDIMDEYEANRDIDVESFAGRLDRWFTDHFRGMDARLHKYLGV